MNGSIHGFFASRVQPLPQPPASRPSRKERGVLPENHRKRISYLLSFYSLTSYSLVRLFALRLFADVG